MNIYSTLGALLIASPFIALFIFVWKEEGFKVALGIYGAVAALLVAITAGLALISMGAS